MFELEFSVRDYECDMQGIVNNAVYQHYFEHARHTYLKQNGIDFSTLTQQGIYLVMYRAEVDYLRPLKSSTRFKVTAEIKRTSKTRCLIHQSILSEGLTYTEGTFYVTAINTQNKPINLDHINISKLNLKASSQNKGI